MTGTGQHDEEHEDPCPAPVSIYGAPRDLDPAAHALRDRLDALAERERPSGSRGLAGRR